MPKGRRQPMAVRSGALLAAVAPEVNAVAAENCAASEVKDRSRRVIGCPMRRGGSWTRHRSGQLVGWPIRNGIRSGLRNPSGESRAFYWTGRRVPVARDLAQACDLEAASGAPRGSLQVAGFRLGLRRPAMTARAWRAASLAGTVQGADLTLRLRRPAASGISAGPQGRPRPGRKIHRVLPRDTSVLCSRSDKERQAGPLIAATPS